MWNIIENLGGLETLSMLTFKVKFVYSLKLIYNNFTYNYNSRIIKIINSN